MDIVPFVWNALAGGIAYDAVKACLGKTAERLIAFVRNDEKTRFEDTLRAVVESNDKIRQQLEALQAGASTVNITTGNITHNGSGDINVASTITVKK
jgi:hypothetical protein